MVNTARHARLTATTAAIALAAAGIGTAPSASAAPSKAATKTAAKSATSAKHRTAIRQFRRALQTPAPVGSVAHFKGTHGGAGGREPWSIEGWVEFGGADRYRYVQIPPRGEGAPGERQIVWGRGAYWAVTDVMRTERGLREVTNVGYTDPAVAFDNFVLGLRYADDAQGLFDTAPAGPTVGGAATRSVPVALPFAPVFGNQSITFLLSATTRTPVRLTNHIELPDGTVVDDSATDFALWQQLPAGTGAAMLGGEVPMTATIQSAP